MVNKGKSRAVLRRYHVGIASVFFPEIAGLTGRAAGPGHKRAPTRPNGFGRVVRPAHFREAGKTRGFHPPYGFGTREPRSARGACGPGSGCHGRAIGPSDKGDTAPSHRRCADDRGAPLARRRALRFRPRSGDALWMVSGACKHTTLAIFYQANGQIFHHQKDVEEDNRGTPSVC